MEFNYFDLLPIELNVQILYYLKLNDINNLLWDKLYTPKFFKSLVEPNINDINYLLWDKLSILKFSKSLNDYNIESNVNDYKKFYIDIF